MTQIDNDSYTWQSVSREVDGEVLPNIEEVQIVRESPGLAGVVISVDTGEPGDAASPADATEPADAAEPAAAAESADAPQSTGSSSQQ
jgi:hypothetical protein